MIEFNCKLCQHYNVITNSYNCGGEIIKKNGFCRVFQRTKRDTLKEALTFFIISIETGEITISPEEYFQITDEDIESDEDLKFLFS